MVLEIFAIAAVLVLSFALLFRKGPIELKLTIEHKHQERVSDLKSMLKDIDKTEKDLMDDSQNILGFVNELLQGKFPEDNDGDGGKQ